MATQTRRSVCPYDCPDACGLMVDVDGNRALKVYGDADHHYTRGFVCSKMKHYQDTVHSSERLTTPLLRNGAKGEGNFIPISWDEAIERICSAWKKIIADCGAEAILPYSYAGTMGVVQRNAGHPFFNRLGASQLIRTICVSAKGSGWEAVMGKTPAPRPTSVAKSDLIIIWGANTPATNIHAVPDIKAAKANGSQVILIETYETPAAALADRTILVKPGQDGALALGIMHILVRDGRIDKDFLNERVLGFNELKEQILPDFPPQKVAEITGVATGTLEILAQAIATAEAPYIILGSGLSRYSNGAMSVRCIVTLPALVAAYGKPGGGCFAGTSTGAAFNMVHLLREDLINGEPRSINMNQLGDALTSPLDPPVKSLYVYHSNPAAIAPDQNRVICGLKRDDLFTVVHERFMTDTARYADIVLPACSSLETSDIYRSYGHYAIQRCEPAIAPVGQSRSNWDTFSLLAKGMGFDDPIFNRSAEEMIDLLITEPNPWLDTIDRDVLAAGRSVELTPPESQAFVTPSGKIEILNPRLAEPLPCYRPPSDQDFPLRLMTAPSLHSLNSSFQERTQLRRRQRRMTLQVHPVEAEKRGLKNGQQVSAYNDLGDVTFYLKTTEKVQPGVAIAEGIWWMEHAPGKRTVNALTSQKLTDLGKGSTFYDNSIDIRAVEKEN